MIHLVFNIFFICVIMLCSLISIEHGGFRWLSTCHKTIKSWAYRSDCVFTPNWPLKGGHANNSVSGLRITIMIELSSSEYRLIYHSLTTTVLCSCRNRSRILWYCSYFPCILWCTFCKIVFFSYGKYGLDKLCETVVETSIKLNL